LPADHYKKEAVFVLGGRRGVVVRTADPSSAIPQDAELLSSDTLNKKKSYYQRHCLFNFMLQRM
jgi:hypothetical protein